jgi:prevent-host-death family protein
VEYESSLLLLEIAPIDPPAAQAYIPIRKRNMPSSAPAKAKSNSRVVSTSIAHAEFGKILRRVRRNRERFIIEQRGQPQAILMSLEDYIDTIAPPPDWLKEAWKASKEAGTDKMTLREIDAQISEVRGERQPRSPKRSMTSNGANQRRKPMKSSSSGKENEIPA